MSEQAGAGEDWIAGLARFLNEEQGVNAVRIDPVSRRVSVATWGRAPVPGLEERLAAAIAAVTTRGAELPAAAPAGFRLRREGGMTELGRLAGSTAEKLWLWREMEWPEIRAEAAPEEQEWKFLALLATLCGAAGLAASAAGHFLPEWPWLARGLFLLALAAGAWDAAIDTWASLRKRAIDIHFLMLAVATGAVLIGAWGEAVLLLFLFSASGAMEGYALHRTQREVGSLLKSAPKQATLLDADGREREVAVEAVRPGQRLRVRPGQAFAADGSVVAGRSASDESALTGEANPVPKAPGDPVYSGTLNLWGQVDFDVTRPQRLSVPL